MLVSGSENKIPKSIVRKFCDAKEAVHFFTGIYSSVCLTLAGKTKIFRSSMCCLHSFFEENQNSRQPQNLYSIRIASCLWGSCFVRWQNAY